MFVPVRQKPMKKGDRGLMTYLPRTLVRVLNVAIDHLLFGGGALAMEDRLPVRSEVEKIEDTPLNVFESSINRGD